MKYEGRTKMKWKDTESYQCRYSECASEFLEDAEIIAEDSEASYQGSVNLVAKLPDGRYIYFCYNYGSCSYCDEWENRDLTSEEIVEEMKTLCSEYFDIDELERFILTLKDDLYGCFIGNKKDKILDYINRKKNNEI